MHSISRWYRVSRGVRVGFSSETEILVQYSPLYLMSQFRGRTCVLLQCVCISLKGVNPFPWPSGHRNTEPVPTTNNEERERERGNLSSGISSWPICFSAPNSSLFCDCGDRSRIQTDEHISNRARAGKRPGSQGSIFARAQQARKKHSSRNIPPLRKLSSPSHEATRANGHY